MSSGPEPAEPSGRLVAIFAFACALSVANIYYAQPLVGFIAPELHLSPRLSGFIMTLTQLGYGTGLLFLVPLADLFENRRLIVLAISGVVVGLAGIALAPGAATFMAASFVVGVCAVATQILVPLISHLTPERARGRVVGNVMGGLLAGIMLARPIASVVSGHLGWRTVFAGSAVAMALAAVVLARVLPQRQPTGARTYRQTLRSMAGLVATTPALRRRALYQGLMFGMFTLFWTATPLLLVKQFGISHDGLAWFTLAGAAGALSAPLAGRLADRGWSRPATGLAMATAAVAFGLGLVAAEVDSLPLLVVAAVLLDGAVQITQVVSLRAIYLLAPENRSRLNGLYMAFTFVCGATSSALATAIYAYGWPALAWTGVGIAVCALLAFATEPAASATVRAHA